MPVLLKPPLLQEVDGPLVFTAGPIQGAENWQMVASNLLLGMGVNVADPRAEKFGETHGFSEQVAWEHHYLKIASRTGCVLFWLAAEDIHDCGRSYAQTTRLELGEALALAYMANANVVIGFENGFTGIRYIEETVANKCSSIPIVSNLKEACQLAAELAKSHGAHLRP